MVFNSQIDPKFPTQRAPLRSFVGSTGSMNSSVFGKQSSSTCDTSGGEVSLMYVQIDISCKRKQIQSGMYLIMLG